MILCPYLRFRLQQLMKIDTIWYTHKLHKSELYLKNVNDIELVINYLKSDCKMWLNC